MHEHSLQRKHNEEQRIVTNSLYASSYQNILQCTDQVTKCIQTLCKCMMNTNGNEDYPACAEKIRYAVTTLAGNLQMVSVEVVIFQINMLRVKTHCNVARIDWLTFQQLYIYTVLYIYVHTPYIAPASKN